MRSLRSELTTDGKTLHELVDSAVDDALCIHRPADGLQGLMDLGVVLDVLEERLVEELEAEANESVEASAAPDVWRRVSAR